MAASNDSNVKSGNEDSISGEKQCAPSAEQVVAGFQRLRLEQRTMATKVAELEMDITEHSLVMEALREVDPTRRCYRLIGGVLVERTVQEVLPALESNKEQISKIVVSLNTQMQAKGHELNEYRERFNIRIVGEEETLNKMTASEEREGAGTTGGGGTGVLVA